MVYQLVWNQESSNEHEVTILILPEAESSDRTSIIAKAHWFAISECDSILQSRKAGVVKANQPKPNQSQRIFWILPEKFKIVTLLYYSSL